MKLYRHKIFADTAMLRPNSSPDATFEMLASKYITDSDGMLTEYTLYGRPDGSYYICMYGDRDIYGPDPNYADWEGKSEDEAWDWFYSYSTDADDIYSADSITAGTAYVRIARYGEFDNGHVLHGDWVKMDKAAAEDQAYQKSIDDPNNLYYVEYDNIMDPSSDLYWYQGESYQYDDPALTAIRQEINNRQS